MIGELELPLPLVEPDWADESAPDPVVVVAEMSDQDDFEEDDFDDFDDDFDDDFEEELEDEYNFEDDEQFGEEDADGEVGEPEFEGDLDEFEDAAEPLVEDGELAVEEEDEDEEFEELEDEV